ncbi:GTP-binding protein [soil metagenome]
MTTNVLEKKEIELLRFITAGSVDDGKSTLIGRLLFDSNSLLKDQVSAITSHVNGELNFANLTDGLRAEREQGITIDVAYRYFSTAKRRFIVADTPGHVQYTRNMFTAASSTNLAVILVDVTNGITEQTRRHTYLSSLIGIQHIVVCFNKMDLVGYSEQKFVTLRDHFLKFASSLNFNTVEFIPIAALHGDNLVRSSQHMAWFEGQPLLSYLESIDISAISHGSARFPVQWVINVGKNDDFGRHFRGYAGQIYSGEFNVGDKVTILPSGRKSKISNIHTFDGPLLSAQAPQSVTLLLDDDIDVGRGDMIVNQNFELPQVSKSLTAVVCWMSDEPLGKGRTYSIKQSARDTRVKVEDIRAQIDINTLESKAVLADTLTLNDIGIVEFSAASSLVFDSYTDNRLTGSFIIIDESTNATAGAGLSLTAEEVDRFLTALNSGEL